MTNTTQAAKTFGAIAYANGLPLVPALDENFLSLLSGREIGHSQTLKDAAAWQRGWIDASLSA